jgi:hypothetical protein
MDSLYRSIHLLGVEPKYSNNNMKLLLINIARIEHLHCRERKYWRLNYDYIGKIHINPR